MTTTNLDIAPWLVTPQNPPRQISGLDYHRCAILHNYIVQLGWLGAGLPPDELPKRTWFDTHSTLAYQQRSRLHPSVIEFLHRAWDVSETMAFFDCVRGLSSPEGLWKDHTPGVVAGEGEELRFLTLYGVDDGFGGHRGRLNYDQHTFKAIMQSNIADDDGTRCEQGAPDWQPLETVLSAWVDMIHTGKIQAKPKGTDADNGMYYPWIFVRSSVSPGI